MKLLFTKKQANSIDVYVIKSESPDLVMILCRKAMFRSSYVHHPMMALRFVLKIRIWGARHEACAPDG